VTYRKEQLPRQFKVVCENTQSQGHQVYDPVKYVSKQNVNNRHDKR
jgi:hypothetical protein